MNATRSQFIWMSMVFLAALVLVALVLFSLPGAQVGRGAQAEPNAPNITNGQWAAVKGGEELLMNTNPTYLVYGGYGIYLPAVRK